MEKQPKKSNKQLNPFLKFTTVGLQMGVTIWLGNLLGQWLDKKYLTEYWENTVTLFAIFASLYLVISQVLKMSK